MPGGLGGPFRELRGAIEERREVQAKRLLDATVLPATSPALPIGAHDAAEEAFLNEQLHLAAEDALGEMMEARRT